MLLAQQKRSKSWLADEIGISKQALNYILAHASKKKCVNEIALALSVSPEWLKTGKGSMTVSAEPRTDVHAIRVLPMQCIDGMAQSSEVLLISAAYPASCFAVRLDNDSMEPLFPEGSLLIFDPEKKPNNKDFVLFSLAHAKQRYFRQYFKEGNDCYLKAIDGMYQMLQGSEFHLHGTLVESRRCFK